MSRGFADPSLQGIRTLEVWAGKDENRRFQIRWEGPLRRFKFGVGEVGGYKVATWTGDNVKSPAFHVGRTLQDAALEAIKAIDGSTE